MAAESALAKSVSAAQTITRRAEQAAKAMAEHQQELNKREKALRQDSRANHGQDDGKDKKGAGKGKRNAKRKQWWSNSGQDWKKGR